MPNWAPWTRASTCAHWRGLERVPWVPPFLSPFNVIGKCFVAVSSIGWSIRIVFRYSTFVTTYDRSSLTVRILKCLLPVFARLVTVSVQERATSLRFSRALLALGCTISFFLIGSLGAPLSREGHSFSPTCTLSARSNYRYLIIENRVT